jgi:pimeloyl-ACP methyl ester carboxylesterase
VIWHHGTPGSGLPYRRSIEEATERGLRLVSYSRSGYGTSTRDEGRSVAACAPDVAAIADHLNAERFYTGGGSGGGPHALACAALLPDRVMGAVSVSGIVPWGSASIDFLEGMGEANHEEFGAALDGPDALRAWIDAHWQEWAEAETPDEIVASMQDLVSEVDRASVTGEFAAYLAQDGRIALANGYWGWFDDDLAFTRDWGFRLEDIRVPVAVWQGGQDRFVPYAHGAWLAEHVLGARAHLYEEHGHLSLGLASFGAILGDLVENRKD